MTAEQIKASEKISKKKWQQKNKEKVAEYMRLRRAGKTPSQLKQIDNTLDIKDNVLDVRDNVLDVKDNVIGVKGGNFWTTEKDRKEFEQYIIDNPLDEFFLINEHLLKKIDKTNENVKRKKKDPKLNILKNPRFIKWVKSQAKSKEMQKMMINSESIQKQYKAIAKKNRHCLTEDEMKRGSEIVGTGKGKDRRTKKQIREEEESQLKYENENKEPKEIILSDDDKKIMDNAVSPIDL